jgi:hypothetical protein
MLSVLLSPIFNDNSYAQVIYGEYKFLQSTTDNNEDWMGSGEIFEGEGTQLFTQL